MIENLLGSAAGGAERSEPPQSVAQALLGDAKGAAAADPDPPLDPDGLLGTGDAHD